MRLPKIKNIDLDEQDRNIAFTKAIRLSATEAIEVLKNHGIELTINQYRNRLQKIREKSIAQLATYAKDIAGQHIERIHILEFCEKEQIRLYSLIPDEQPNLKRKFLQDIIDIQPILSAYHEASPYMLPKPEELEKEKKKGLSFDNPNPDDHSVLDKK